ncbi:TetR/AcrR family transcriptional regulator [Pseudonocardia sp. KRD291]|uniref:TetR/AcrR family transcriptional regulator n=1 Tax=Pseudonocardia sp. KRD291 TaxID=2792007 RepID=UPI001C4A455E|nr:TetR/AcrR family transcriptional regulator [Pseudonocardia sp. KRD291]MBW0105271.1 TetR family transcriptional regulator [Pseudonocardia sp. KRD291]
MPARARTDRSTVTRERILDAAEQLFAEHGVYAVSNRAVAEAAGQGNTAVVGYHFGTKTDLVRAIAARHTEQIEQRRAEMVEVVAGSREVRDWIDCLVRPGAEHLAQLGNPTWWARFGAQVMTDPALREIMSDDALTSPALRRIVDGLNACLPTLPVEVRLERGDIGRHLMVQMLAERERALAEGVPTPRSTWSDAATGLVDALVGVWLAPVTSPTTPTVPPTPSRRRT